MPQRSAGILAYRFRNGELEFLLVHPGGPFWRRRDLGAWSIPKGEYADGEDAKAAALREFTEETGWSIAAELVPLGEIRQKGGKIVTAFAAEADFDVATLQSNMFETEWPPRRGRRQLFPEVDRAAWFPLAEAQQRIIPAQGELLLQAAALAGRSSR
jgi:predicted NUDIX family NTP pyrophosphohydrolase